MRIGWALLGLALTAGAANASGCGERLALTVQPVEKADDVVPVLRRRLEAAGVKTPAVERDGAGLSAVLPDGLGERLLTDAGKFEMRIVSDAADSQKFQRLDGGAADGAEPQIILDEFRVREAKFVDDPSAPDPRFALKLQFRLDPVGMRNLMAATADAVGRKLAVIVDDQIVMTPIIRAPVAAGSGEIAGGFTRENTAWLTQAMRGGRLPAEVRVAAREPASCKSE